MLEVAKEVLVVETKSGHCVLMLCTVAPLNLVDCVGFYISIYENGKCSSLTTFLSTFGCQTSLFVMTVSQTDKHKRTLLQSSLVCELLR
jgi:hypothetical protein